MSEALNTRFYTPEEYLALEEKAEYKSEYYQGRIYAMSGGSPNHSLITMNIGGALWQALKGKPCRAYDSNLRVLVKSNGLYTYPDVLVICGELQLTPNRKDTITNPTVIVEVLSPSTASYDLNKKFELYQEIETFQDYIAISQDRVLVHHFYKMEDGIWDRRYLMARDRMLELASIRVNISVNDIYYEVKFAE